MLLEPGSHSSGTARVVPARMFFGIGSLHSRVSLVMGNWDLRTSGIVG